MIMNDSRRGFAKKVGLAGAGAAAFLANTNVASAAITDVDILNFALNLEYLEAEFYTLGTSGKTIDQMGITISGGTSAGGITTGGAQVSFFNNSTLYNSLLQIAADERAHVTLIQTAIKSLGGTPIAKPNLNLNALGLGFASQEQFISLARIFEDIGVSAYGGAAPLITTNSVLATAARILAAEAYHASNLRLHAALYQAPGVMLDGADSVPPPTGTQYFPTNANGLTPVRTPGQVLYLAYGNAANATSGGFFPAGVNGNINSSTTAATANS
jgi:hypothetical protein